MIFELFFLLYRDISCRFVILYTRSIVSNMKPFEDEIAFGSLLRASFIFCVA